MKKNLTQVDEKMEQEWNNLKCFKPYYYFDKLVFVIGKRQLENGIKQFGIFNLELQEHAVFEKPETIVWNGYWLLDQLKLATNVTFKNLVYQATKYLIKVPKFTPKPEVGKKYMYDHTLIEILEIKKKRNKIENFCIKYLEDDKIIKENKKGTICWEPRWQLSRISIIL